MKVFVVLALALASASAGILPLETPVHPKDVAGVPSIQGRITNGKNAAENQFPYQVGLSFSASNGDGWWCGGSLISNTWVLTAAHCTDGAKQVKTYLGSTARTSPKVTNTVSSSNFRQHANYNSKTLNNDISLIMIPSVTYTASINKIALPAIASSYSTYAGQTATASGWGKDSDTASGVTSVLKYIELTVITNTQCASTYGTSTVNSGVICTSSVNKQSTCSGDSGGPLALLGKLIGVTSFVSKSGCEKNSPAGFARVTNFLDWIRTNSGVVG